MPSEWAEEHRVLPRSTTRQPGPFSWDATPYWREVIDCVDPEDPTRFIAVQKGAQVAATVGLLENVIGYYIEHVKGSPILFFTADKELADLRVDENIMPMLTASGMSHLIQSNDELRAGKQGATNKKISWAGGGFMVPYGANNANKMRSLSVPILLRDEISGWPLIVGRDADPLKLTETRTNSYEQSRKVVDLSTPNLTATDAISKRFKLGDQRYYEVPCKHCGKHQVLRFRGVNDDGTRYGLVWDMDDPYTVTEGSVRYLCKYCQGEMTNDDKITIMGQGRWVPTAKPRVPHFRSYHLSALYAPYFARTWEAIAIAWVEAWDDTTDTLRDGELLQVFYNNDLGEPYELKTDKIKTHQVSPHRRDDYKRGELPGPHAEQWAGGRIGLLTMAVDVHKDWLAVAVFAWAPSGDRRGYAAYTIDYWRIDGDTESADAAAWQELEKVIDSRTYVDRDREYPIELTFIDAGYRPEAVYTFCAQWDKGVYPLRGRDKPTKGARLEEFRVMENATGTRYVSVTVDIYKDRWSGRLKRDWNGQGHMPTNNWSAPSDLPDSALKELTMEYKREKRDPASNKLLGTQWYRPSGARQELWDLMVYNTAAVEVAALEVCQEWLELEYLDWASFWDLVEAKQLYWTNRG
jgi:phage terminase large subunit GpA-like protein